MIATNVKTLSYWAGGQQLQSASGKYADVFNPSTGEVLAQTPLCTEEEVNRAIQAASAAFPAWANTPAIKRVQVLYNFRSLIDEHLDELTHTLCAENGKVWDEVADAMKAYAACERRYNLLETGAGTGSDLFSIARSLVRLEAEKPKPAAAGRFPSTSSAPCAAGDRRRPTPGRD